MEKSNTKQNAIHYWLIFIILSLLFQELILRNFLGYGGFSLFLFLGILPLFIMGILLEMSLPWRRILADIYFIAMSLLFVSQFLYYRFFSNLFSFYMFKGAAQIADFNKEVMGLIISNLPWLLLFCLPLFLYFRVYRNRLDHLNSKKNLGKKLMGLSLILLLGLHLMMLSLPLQGKKVYNLYFYSNPLVERAREFGLIGGLGIDLRQKIFGEPVLGSFSQEEYKEENLLDEKSFTRASVTGEEKSNVEKQSEQEESPPLPQVLELDFKELQKEREKDSLALMDAYFGSVKPTYSNEYTGIFKDYNLIFLTAESFWWPAVDKERTPILYRMVQEGIRLENFYNPIWTVSTFDGEFVGLTGMVPKDGIWSLYKTAFNTSPQSLGWRMKAQGYSCYAYHNHYYTYYDRHESHPNLGYDYKGLGSGVEVEEQWPESDLEMMEVTMEEYIDKEPFHVYYLTVSGHSGYSFSGNAMASKNKDYVEELDLSEEAASFLAANMELEHALAYLLKKLEEKGIASRTLIVLNPDHIPYALSEGAMEELAGEFHREIDRYKSHGIIYVPGMESIRIEKPVSSVDLLPTIYNLLGISYDSRLLTGRDVFSEEGLVIFYNRSWISEKGYYDSRSGVFEALEDQLIPQGYVEKMNQRVQEEFYFSGLILEEDYYAHLPEKAFLP